MNDYVNVIVDDLNKFLIEKFNLDEALAYATDSGNISTESNENFKIYMRVCSSSINFPEKTLVFANVTINPRRNGIMTDLIKMFCEDKLKYGIDYIGLEQCYTPCSKGFAAKYNFIRLEQNTKDVVNVNYYISCEEFLNNLRNILKIKK